MNATSLGDVSEILSEVDHYALTTNSDECDLVQGRAVRCDYGQMSIRGINDDERHEAELCDAGSIPFVPAAVFQEAGLTVGSRLFQDGWIGIVIAIGIIRGLRYYWVMDELTEAVCVVAETAL